MEMYLTEESLVTVTVVEEGQESDLFWLTVSGKKKNYLSLLNGENLNLASFHFVYVTGGFSGNCSPLQEKFSPPVPTKMSMH